MAEWNRKLLPESVVIAIDDRDLAGNSDYHIDQGPRAEALLQDPQYVRSTRLARELEYIGMSRHYEKVTREEGNPDTLPPFIEAISNK